jgi:ABC-type Mn2+/Zn2+ transport system ATPase subunit
MPSAFAKWRIADPHITGPEYGALLSQNLFPPLLPGAERLLPAQAELNFVVDLTVNEFVAMHAQSRMAAGLETMVDRVVECANELTGEKFFGDTSLTQLSGGQSRALMIADTALLSVSPIVLIDEIENAGVERKKALELLVKKAKIVLISTHDPLLALMGARRIVINNGGIAKVIASNSREKACLQQLEWIDCKMMELRRKLRYGEEIDMDVTQKVVMGW